MREIKAFWFFYQKLMLPSIALSLLLSAFSMAYVKLSVGFGVSYMILTPVFHYFTYDVKNVHEYYFYFNLGLSKALLWICTIATSFFLGLFFLLL